MTERHSNQNEREPRIGYVEADSYTVCYTNRFEDGPWANDDTKVWCYCGEEATTQAKVIFARSWERDNGQPRIQTEKLLVDRCDDHSFEI